MSKSKFQFDLQWRAAQGCKTSQREYAQVCRDAGELKAAEFWEAKANGHPATTVENYFLNK